MADGFQGPGYFDANGQWRSFGTTINSTDPNTAGFQPDSNYNPDQATGWNARPTNMAEPPVDPGPAFRTNTVHAGGPVATRPITTPNSSTGAPAVQSPSASTYQPPATQTRPGLLTPNSSTGASRYPIQKPPPQPDLYDANGDQPFPRRPCLRGGLYRCPCCGADAQAVCGDQGIYNNANAAGKYFDSTWLGKQLNWLTGNKASPTWGGGLESAAAPQTQTQPQSAPAPPSGAPTATATPPPPPPINLPPFNVPPPPGNLPPFVRGPIPYNMPQHGGAQRAGAPNLGYGVPGASQQPAAPQAPSPMFTTIDRPNADTAGGPSRAGQLAPQYFNRAREPGGPAQMGALDLSGMFNHPAVAQAAAAPPSVPAAARAPVQGQLSALAPTARAPMIQPQGTHFGSTARKVFGNPAMWQYPNVQM